LSQTRTGKGKVALKEFFKVKNETFLDVGRSNSYKKSFLILEELLVEYKKNSSSDERLMASLIYISSLFTTFLGPLIIWLLKKDDSELVNHHGKEYFNFLISYGVYSIISTVLMIVLIGFITIWIVAALAFVFTIVAAVKAYEGNEYRIPLVFRLIK
jgi:uncharacterized protein